MSAIFYMDPGVEVDVANPGYGQILLFVTDTLPYNGQAGLEPWQRRPLVTKPWQRDLHGAEIGEFLDKLTEQALTPDPGPAPVPGSLLRPATPVIAAGMQLPAFLKPAVARVLLPVFQKASFLAIAGTDRYDRTFPDPDDGPRPPYCARCNLGTIYTPDAMESAWCQEYGHIPFGTADRTSWAASTAHYERRRRWWEDDQQRERDAAARASGLEQSAIDLDKARRTRRPDQGA